MMKFPKNLGMLLLGIWLILWGVLPLLKASFPHQDLILEAIAIAAGILVLLGR